MSAGSTITISLITAIATALITAWLSYLFTTKIESRKIAQRRQAAGVMLQAELIHIHFALKEHDRLMQGYILKIHNIGGTGESDYPKFEINDELSVFQNSMAEIGLLDGDTSYQLVYCYYNIDRFKQEQSKFRSELPKLLNSSMLEMHAQNLSAVEKALTTQIERIVPVLAKQSRAIPFNPGSG
jgi:hypothetical protein